MWKRVGEAIELLGSAEVTGDSVAAVLRDRGADSVVVTTVEEAAKTQFLMVTISGRRGKTKAGGAPTLGIVGNLGGIRGRPAISGLASDADGAVCALAVVLMLLDMKKSGDALPGDVILSTHICTDAPTIPHEPVPFMGNPTYRAITKTINYVDAAMDAIVHVETSRANRIVNVRGFAISPTVRAGYILRVSNDALDIMQNVTGQWPVVVPLSTIDLTPIDNGLYHLNGLAQENLVTDAPIIGVAITSAMPVAGSTTGANQIVDIESASRFVLEVCRSFSNGNFKFFDEVEFEKIVALYGRMAHLGKIGPEN